MLVINSISKIFSWKSYTITFKSPIWTGIWYNKTPVSSFLLKMLVWPFETSWNSKCQFCCSVGLWISGTYLLWMFFNFGYIQHKISHYQGRRIQPHKIFSCATHFSVHFLWYIVCKSDWFIPFIYFPLSFLSTFFSLKWLIELWIAFWNSLNYRKPHNQVVSASLEDYYHYDFHYDYYLKWSTFLYVILEATSETTEKSWKWTFADPHHCSSSNSLETLWTK